MIYFGENELIIFTWTSWYTFIYKWTKFDGLEIILMNMSFFVWPFSPKFIYLHIYQLTLLIFSINMVNLTGVHVNINGARCEGSRNVFDKKFPFEIRESKTYRYSTEVHFFWMEIYEWRSKRWYYASMKQK